MALNSGSIPVSIVLSINGVQQTVSGMMQVTGANRKLAQSADSARKSFANLAGAFTGIMMARYVAQALGAIVKPAMEFETAMSRIKALTNATIPQLRMFREEALRIASITPYGPTQMVNVLLKLQRALGDPAAAKAALGPTAQLAMASFGSVSPEKSAEMIAQMVRGFGIKGGDIRTAVERSFAATKAAGLGVEDISGVMGKLASAAALGGQSFDEMIKMFAIARREIPNSERAATQLMTTMGELTRPKVRESLGKLGVVMQDAMGHPRRFGEIMLELSDRYKSSSREVRTALIQAFGVRSLKPIIAILDQLTTGIKTQNGQLLQGRAAYDYMTKSMQDSGGVMDKMSEEYLKTTAARVEVMKESLYNLAVTIGKSVLPSITAMANRLRDIFEWGRKFFSSGFGKAVADFATPLLGWGGLILGGAAAMQGFGKIVKVVLGNLWSMLDVLKKIGTMGAASQIWSAMRGGRAATAGSAATTTAAAVGGATVGTWIKSLVIGAATKWLPLTLLTAAGYGAYKAYQYGTSLSSRQNAKTANRMAAGGFSYHGVRPEADFNTLLPYASAKYKELMKEQQQLLADRKKADELSVKAGHEWFSYIQLGTKAWMESINAFKGIIEYKPPEMDASKLYKLQAQFAAMEKSTRGRSDSTTAHNLALSGQGAAKEINRLLGIAYTNPAGLSPRQMQTLQRAAALMSAWGTQLKLSGTEQFKKAFASQATQVGSEPNVAYNTALLQGSGGRLAGVGNMSLQGWNPGVGGYAGPGALEPYDLGFLKNVWGLTGDKDVESKKSSVLAEMFKTESAAPEGFRKQAAAVQAQKREERLKEVRNMMNNMAKAMSGILGTLDGRAIRVKLEGKDPTTGKTGGADSPLSD